MPMFDFDCGSCGGQFEALHRESDPVVACRLCGSPDVRPVLVQKVRVNGDECDYWAENLGSHPIHIRSWSQRNKIMKKVGLVDADRFLGAGTMDPQTMRNAEILVSRGATSHGEPTEDDLDTAVQAGEVAADTNIIGSGGNPISLRISRMYHGVLDSSILKR